MSMLTDLRFRLRALFQRDAMETELNDELQFHFDHEVEKLKRAGLSEEEARRRARQMFGGHAQVTEDCREARGTNFLETLGQDIRYAGRQLVTHPAFAVVMVLTLGLSIGANSAIFSVIDSVLIQSLPYPQPNRLVYVYLSSAEYPKFPLNAFDFRDFRTRNKSFESMAAMTRGDLQLSGGGARPVMLHGFRITSGYFHVLGLQPQLGREFDQRAEGVLKSLVLGYTSGFAGITESDQYDTRLQPTLMSDTTPSATIFSVTYGYGLGVNDNGNVQQIENNTNSALSQAFTYDSDNRLLQATSGTTWGFETWNQANNTPGIDAWGNLIQTMPVSGTTMNPMSVNQQVNYANQFTQNGFAYDPAGNVIADGSPTSGCSGYAYAWNAESQMKCAWGVTYTYDGDGGRVEKSSGTMYWGGEAGAALAESNLSGTISSEYIFFNGKRIARRDISPQTVSYYFSDRLNSTSLITNATGGILYESVYYPYGGEDPIIQNSANHYKFTGKERDTESGNDYFGARYYASTMGRFLSPDYVDDGLDPAPVPWAKFENPQSLNLYSYVLNNPLTSTDPDGNDVQVCDANGQCKTISNDAYIAGQHGNNSGLNVPTLGQVGSSKDANGDFTAVNITDANGNTVGTAKYVAGDSPGLDPYLGNNMAGLHTLGVTGATMSDPRTYVAWEAASAAGAVCVLYCAEAATVLPRAVQSAEMNVSAKVVAYLESKGIPAAAASAMAAKWLSQVGTKGPTLAALKADYQQLNQMVRDYRQSH